MAEHFLTKSQIDLGRCLEHDGGLALESHATLQRVLAERVSTEAAALFAEPLVNRGNDEAPASVAWYTDLSGDGRRLSDLRDSERDRAESILSEAVTAIHALADDPEHGPLVSAALLLAGSPGGDVWVINGRPVLINWGMLPAGAAPDAAGRAAVFAGQLGRYLPAGLQPGMKPAAGSGAGSAAGSAAAAAGVGAAAAVAGSRASAAPIDTAPPGAPPSGSAGGGGKNGPPERRYGLMAWLPLVLLLLIAGGVLAWLLTPGTRIFAADDPDAGLSAVETAESVSAINAALTARRDALKAALDGAQCRPDGTLLMPDGLTIEGMLPIDPDNPLDGPGKKADASPTPMLPPDPARVQVPQSGAMATADLLDLIEERTVRVVGMMGGGSASTGTGFFIAPDFVVTNFHVVSDPRITELIVTNERIGRPLAGQVVAMSGPIGTNGDDFALLRIPDASQPFFRILNAEESLKLRSVVAAGFPGDMQFDNSPGSLVRPAAMTLTDGTVTNELTLDVSQSGRFRAVAHSAPISQGNSGGPLVDMCGRVVGVNTFAKAGMLRTINLAISSGDLLEFLARTPTAPDVVTQPCTPEVLRPSVKTVEAQVTEPAVPGFGLPTGPSE